MKIIILALMAIFVLFGMSSSVYAATPVSSITDGIGGFDGAASITTVTIGTDTYALVASGIDNSVLIINITIPASPTVVSTVTDGIGGFDMLKGAHSITTVTIDTQTYALVASFYDDSVLIINITDPYSPQLVSTVIDDVGGFDMLEGAVSITTVTIGIQTYALVVSSNDDSVQIINITDPYSPTVVSSITDGGTDSNGKIFDVLKGAHSITTVTIDTQTYALVAASHDNGVQIINITTPAFPTVVFSITDGDTDSNGKTFDMLEGVASITTVTIGNDTYALVASSIDDSVLIINITDPYSPQLVSTVIDDVGGFDMLEGAHSITTVTIGTDTYALVAAYDDDGVQIINITIPASPTVVSSITDGIGGFDGLDGAISITTVTIGTEIYALVAAYDDDGIQIINIVENSSASTTTSSGTVTEEGEDNPGGCNNCEAPTLGINSKITRIVENGFTYNGKSVDAERYYTPYPLITVNVGEPNTAVFRIYEDIGPQNIKHFSFAFGLNVGQIIGNSKAMIELDIDYDGTETVTITDPENALENVNVSTHVANCNSDGDEEKKCLIVTIDHTFRAPLGFNIVATDVWDMERNAWQNYFNHGIEVTGESLNPPKEYSGINRGHIYHLIETSKTTAVDEFGDTWTIKHGNWEKDFILTGKIKDDPTNVMTRDHSEFTAYKDAEILKATILLLETCPGCFEKYADFEDSWAYEFPESFDSKLDNSRIILDMDLENGKAQEIINHILDPKLHLR